MERTILLLGDPRLYEPSEEVKREELEQLRPVFADMFDCIKGIRRDYGFGRAIAAPQIGVQKRLICILTDKPYVILNPQLEFIGDEQMDTDKKESSELASLILTKDFFKKIIVRMDIPHNFYDDNGIFHCNLIDLLLCRVELF